MTEVGNPPTDYLEVWELFPSLTPGTKAFVMSYFYDISINFDPDDDDVDLLINFDRRGIEMFVYVLLHYAVPDEDPLHKEKCHTLKRLFMDGVLASNLCRNSQELMNLRLFVREVMDRLRTPVAIELLHHLFMLERLYENRPANSVVYGDGTLCAKKRIWGPTEDRVDSAISILWKQLEITLPYQLDPVKMSSIPLYEFFPEGDQYTRIVRIMEKEGVNTVHQLLCMTSEAFRSFRGIGAKKLVLTQRALRSVGWELGYLT